MDHLKSGASKFQWTLPSLGTGIGCVSRKHLSPLSFLEALEQELKTPRTGYPQECCGRLNPLACLALSALPGFCTTFQNSSGNFSLLSSCPFKTQPGHLLLLQTFIEHLPESLEQCCARLWNSKLNKTHVCVLSRLSRKAGVMMTGSGPPSPVLGRRKEGIWGPEPGR